MGANKKTVFLLEDDDAFLIVFARWLGMAGYEVVSAQNTEEAEKLLETIDPPSLFWLDYYLEEDNTGMDFFHKLQETPRFKDVPVIIVSITSDIERLQEFKKEGVTEVFSKVIANRDTIMDGVKKIIEGK